MLYKQKSSWSIDIFKLYKYIDLSGPSCYNISYIITLNDCHLNSLYQIS